MALLEASSQIQSYLLTVEVLTAPLWSKSIEFGGDSSTTVWYNLSSKSLASVVCKLRGGVTIDTFSYKGWWGGRVRGGGVGGGNGPSLLKNQRQMWYSYSHLTVNFYNLRINLIYFRIAGLQGSFSWYDHCLFPKRKALLHILVLQG